MSDDASEAMILVEAFVGDALQSLLANAQAVEAHPGDRHVGARIQSDLILLERLFAVRRGLRDA